MIISSIGGKDAEYGEDEGDSWRSAEGPGLVGLFPGLLLIRTSRSQQ